MCHMHVCWLCHAARWDVHAEQQSGAGCAGEACCTQCSHTAATGLSPVLQLCGLAYAGFYGTGDSDPDTLPADEALLVGPGEGGEDSPDGQKQGRGGARAGLGCSAHVFACHTRKPHSLRQHIPMMSCARRFTCQPSRWLPTCVSSACFSILPPWGVSSVQLNPQNAQQYSHEHSRPSASLSCFLCCVRPLPAPPQLSTRTAAMWCMP